MRSPRRIVPGLLLGLLGLVPQALADDSPGDPKARALLDEVVKAYKALAAYEDHGAFTIAIKADGKPSVQSYPSQISFVRPNRMKIDAGAARFFIDGKTATIVEEPLKTFDAQPAPAEIRFNTVFTGGAVGSLLFGGPGGPMMQLLLNLLVGSDASRALSDLGPTATLGPEKDVDGTKCQVVVLKGTDRPGAGKSQERPAFVLTIDPQTKLLREIHVDFNAASLKDLFPPGRKIELTSFGWSSGAISTTAPADATFAFEPPQDFKKVSAVVGGQPEPEAPKYEVQKKIGKPAPDFTMTLLEPEGKTRTVSRADLAGKVVVIDFWATWCGPCLKELPEVARLVESYTKAGKEKELVVVALSQDDDPRDPVEVRKLVEKTLKENEVDLTGGPVGKVGIDPSGSVGKAFDVEGFPTVVILDAKGSVAAAHVGYSADVGKKLAKDIDALIDGKSQDGPAK